MTFAYPEDEAPAAADEIGPIATTKQTIQKKIIIRVYRRSKSRKSAKNRISAAVV
jgi:hypothetical protein